MQNVHCKCKICLAFWGKYSGRGKARIDYKETADGIVKVNLEGVPFVGMVDYHEIGTRIDKTTGYATPYWKYLSSGYDKATLFVDGVSKATASGEQAWRKWDIVVSGSGRHRAEWRYQKDGSVAKGGDCVWLDDVAWEAS